MSEEPEPEPESELKTMNKEEFKAMEEMFGKLGNITPEQFKKNLESLPADQAGISALVVATMKNSLQIEILTQHLNALEKKFESVTQKILTVIQKLNDR